MTPPQPWWFVLDRLPATELRRRARIISALSRAESVRVRGAELVRYTSGSGDEASWVFAADGRVMLLVLDHECALNLYADGDVAAQLRMYDGVPADLVAAVSGLPDEEPFLMLGQGPAAVPVASGVFWSDGLAWRPADGLAALADERGLDVARDSGADYCTAWYLLDEPFTPETLIASGADDRFGVSEAALRMLFARLSPG